MEYLSKNIKEKVEKHLKKNECANSIVWGKDSCTAYDAEGNAIDDYMIDVDEDGAIYYTPVSNQSVTISIE